MAARRAGAEGGRPPAHLALRALVGLLVAHPEAEHAARGMIDALAVATDGAGKNPTSWSAFVTVAHRDQTPMIEDPSVLFVTPAYALLFVA